jgi:hypothetical protein
MRRCSKGGSFAITTQAFPSMVSGIADLGR